MVMPGDNVSTSSAHHAGRWKRSSARHPQGGRIVGASIVPDPRIAWEIANALRWLASSAARNYKTKEPSAQAGEGYRSSAHAAGNTPSTARRSEASTEGQ
jgi:hypothetical protein